MVTMTFCFSFPCVPGHQDQEADRRGGDSDGRSNPQPAGGLGLHLRGNLPGAGQEDPAQRHLWLLPLRLHV